MSHLKSVLDDADDGDDGDDDADDADDHEGRGCPPSGRMSHLKSALDDDDDVKMTSLREACLYQNG